MQYFNIEAYRFQIEREFMTRSGLHEFIRLYGARGFIYPTQPAECVFLQDKIFKRFLKTEIYLDE